MKIRILDVDVYYRSIKALDRVTVEIPNNSFTILLGPNGAGKTTFLRILAKLLKPKRGVVYIDGKELAKVSHHRVGYVPQRVSPTGRISVKEFLLSSIKPYGMFFTDIDRRRVREVITTLGIAHLEERALEDLSGGEFQLVLISKALLTNPDVVLLDEPLNNLDIKNQIEIMNFLKNLSKQVTVISSLHDLNMAYKYGDFIIFLKSGKIYAAGKTEDVFTEDVIYQVFGVRPTILREYKSLVL
ncbi:MAG: ABC transporter ATP-binding protein [Candidatus Aenigmatarchaeota archaeon]